MAQQLEDNRSKNRSNSLKKRSLCSSTEMRNKFMFSSQPNFNELGSLNHMRVHKYTDGASSPENTVKLLKQSKSLPF
jgi:hypothetical protein